MVKARPAARTQVVLATDDHAGLMAEFFRTVWDPAATAEGVVRGRHEAARTNPASQGKLAPTFIVIADGRAVGYVTTIPGRIWSEGQEFMGYWLKGLMVLPEYQNGPIGFLLLKEAVRQLDTVLFGMAVALPARKLFLALGFQDLGAVPNRIAILAPRTVAHRLDLRALNLSRLPAWLPSAMDFARRIGVDRLGGVLAGGLRASWAGVGAIGSLGLSRESEGATWEESEVDEIWTAMRKKMGAGAVRDGAYLKWRYQDHDPGQYQVVTVRRSGRLAALAAVKLPRGDDPRLQGIRVASLSDLIHDPDDPAAGVAALRAAEDAARSMEAHALLTGATSRAMLRLLTRRGCLPVPGNVHLLLRGPAGVSLPATLGEWWITRGDGESDGF